MSNEHETATKSSAREATTKFLDEIEPILQGITGLLWPKDGTAVVPADRIHEVRQEVARLGLIARAKEARRWIDVHGGIIHKRMSTRKGQLSRENQALIDRLNVADLTLRSFIVAVGEVEKRTR